MKGSRSKAPADCLKEGMLHCGRGGGGVPVRDGAREGGEGGRVRIRIGDRCSCIDILGFCSGWQT